MRKRICMLHGRGDVIATHAHFHDRRVRFYCDQCISEGWLAKVHAKLCPQPCQKLLEDGNREINSTLKEDKMMLFYLDAESDEKGMQNLTAVSKALTRVVNDLQKKIKDGKDKSSVNGTVFDNDGNPIGEYDCQFG